MNTTSSSTCRPIRSEVGEDRGQMLPCGIEVGWEVTPETVAP
jgi:arylsulfatase